MDSNIMQSEDKLSPKFIWIVVAITIFVNIVICTIIYVTANSTYVIKFNNGTQVLFELKATPGSDIGSYSTTFTSKSGYSFDGWFLDDGVFSKEYTFPETMPSRNVTVYGKWTKLSFKITFDANGGEFLVDSVREISLPYETVLVENISSIGLPTKEGYSFAGWAVNSSTSQVIDASYTVQARNVTLYAVWEE